MRPAEPVMRILCWAGACMEDLPRWRQTGYDSDFDEELLNVEIVFAKRSLELRELARTVGGDGLFDHLMEELLDELLLSVRIGGSVGGEVARGGQFERVAIGSFVFAGGINGFVI